MGDSQEQGAKRDHHVVPRAYLRGFVAYGEKSRLYQYCKGEMWYPGVLKKNNPQLKSINSAGMIRDYYATTKADGTPDYSKYEERLEQLEKPLNDVLASMRRQEMPDDAARQIFAEYILLTIRRVPYHRERIAKEWSNLVDRIRTPEYHEQILEDCLRAAPHALEALKQNPELRKEMLKEIVIETLSGYSGKTQERVLNDYTVGPSAWIAPNIYSMTWRFLVAMQDQKFATSDNPVYFSDVKGLNKPDSELIFPISGEVCLYASNHPDVYERFVPVGNTVVRQVNERTASRAKMFLYSPLLSNELFHLLNNPPDSLSPMLF